MLGLQKTFAVLLLALSGFPAEPTETNDWLIVPGERVGPITARTTRADLIRIFGAKSVEDGDITIADEVEPGTFILKSQPDATLAILWKENSPQPHVASIEFIRGPNYRWHTADGITFGLSLKALEKMNGRAFKVLGFAWDWEGTVMSWDSGRLEKLMHSCAGLGMRLLPDPNKGLPDDLVGDHEIWSSEPEMQALNPTIAHMSFGFEPTTGCKN